MKSEHAKQGFQPFQKNACAATVEVETKKNAPQEPQKTLFEKKSPAIKQLFLPVGKKTWEKPGFFPLFVPDFFLYALD